MGKLGISIYPEKSNIEENKTYLELAHKYGFRRLFISLLEIKGNKSAVISKFKQIISYANSLDFEVTMDINPAIFRKLNISYASTDSLSFFRELGAYAVRLDMGFSGIEEAQMTRNPYGLKIEINMSSGTNYVDNIMSYLPNTDNLLGSHNFYPMRYSGLSLQHFTKCTQKFKKYNLNTLAFVNSQEATMGPWPYNDGLATLEMHRDLPIETQVEHFKLLGGLDDIAIGNAFASEEEIKAMSEAFFATELALKVIPSTEISDNEKTAIFETKHLYRGDCSDYLIRSSATRVLYKDKSFPAHSTADISRGDILIANESFGQYKGETQIALLGMENKGNVNVVGHLTPESLFLLNYMKPWIAFRLIK